MPTEVFDASALQRDTFLLNLAEYIANVSRYDNHRLRTSASDTLPVL
jgi:hypothetical protein